ncbi:hypothetical protein EJ08DRAFT_652187 [Tothia fuscella]|uniref:CFEM domain-containing protein n=1 Tax=Tothia fuscella TaxID=1048955 RepID=A0A9P4NKN5_9PEZI|nr:hypothetical protein EJ08DRAFT_652187 [Tothia fuscella]
MKFTLAAVALYVSSVLAVSQADLPACSIACFQTAIAGTKCSVADIHCQCTTGKAVITNLAGPCLIKACSTEDAAKTLQVSTDICAADAKGTLSSSAGSSGTSSGVAQSATSKASSASSAAAQATSNAASWMKADMFGAAGAVVAAGMMAL